MAIDPKEKLNASGSDQFYIQPRVHPGPGPGAILTRLFASSAGAELLDQLIPVAQVGGSLTPWTYVDGTQTEGTSEVIVGFVWSESVQLSDTGERNGNILAIGEVDYRDVPLPDAPYGGTQQQLEDALAELSLRQRNLTITGGLSTTL